MAERSELSDPEADELFSSFEKIGETKVRNNLAQGIYRARKIQIAERWLQMKEAERHERLSRDNLQIAKSAKNAAWAAAIAAIIAAVFAVMAYLLPPSA